MSDEEDVRLIYSGWYKGKNLFATLNLIQALKNLAYFKCIYRTKDIRFDADVRD